MFDISASTTYLEGRTMANLWGDRALSYYRECRPDEYQAIPDKETFFLELGETAAAQIDTVYRHLRRTDLIDDRMARMQAEETVRDLIYPPPEPGHEDGRESIVISAEQVEQAANLQRPGDPDT